MPGATERLSHGEPTFFVGTRVFVMFSNNHHNDGHVAVVLPVEPGLQPMMIRDAPKKFYFPAYVGSKGWVGMELARVSDRELGGLVKAAWQLVAPKKLIKDWASK